MSTCNINGCSRPSCGSGIVTSCFCDEHLDQQGEREQGYAGNPEDQSPDGYMLRQFLWNECELEMCSRLVRHRMNEKVNERLKEAKLRKRLILPGMKGWIS